MNKILIISLMAVFLIGSVSAIIIFVGIDSVEENQTSVKVNFADGTSVTVNKIYQAEIHNKNKIKDASRLIINTDVSDDTEICIVRNEKIKCLK